MNKKGFTLIELLAVIVILAIIALITAPIVVGIITNSRESSNQVSASNYINAVNTAITKAAIDNIIIENGNYEITKNGNVCIGELKNDKCSSKEIKVSVTGKRPINGNIMIEDEVVVSGVISYEDFSVELIGDGQIEYSPFALKYGIGKELTINIADNVNYNFYVIKEDANTVTLLSSESFGEVPWITATENNSLIKSYETCGTNRCNFIGPMTLMKALNSGLSGLDDLIIKDYEYINNDLESNAREYKKMTIKDGITTLTDYQGNENVVPGTTIARPLTAEEYLELGSRYNKNLTYDNLKKVFVENLDAINSNFYWEFATIEELLEENVMSDDWPTMYYWALVSLGLTMESEEELSYFAVPDWLGLEDAVYWTSSNITLANAASATYVISSETLSDGNSVTIMTTEDVSTNSNSIRPVITIDKNSKRIQ